MSFRRFKLRVEIFSMISRVSSTPLVNRRLLVFSSCKSALQNLAAEQIGQALETLVGQDTDFVGKVLFEFEDLRGFDGLVPLVFFSTLASEDFHVDDGAFDAWRAIERSVANVSGFFTENSAQQLFFRSQRGFALGRYFADQNVAGLYDGADADNAAFVKVAKERFADVGNVASDFFRTELGITGFDFVVLDVDRGVVSSCTSFSLTRMASSKL